MLPMTGFLPRHFHLFFGCTSSMAQTARRDTAQYPSDKIPWNHILYHNNRVHHRISQGSKYSTPQTTTVLSRDCDGAETKPACHALVIIGQMVNEACLTKVPPDHEVRGGIFKIQVT